MRVRRREKQVLYRSRGKNIGVWPVPCAVRRGQGACVVFPDTSYVYSESRRRRKKKSKKNEIYAYYSTKINIQDKQEKNITKIMRNESIA